VRGCSRENEQPAGGGVTKYEIEPICRALACRRGAAVPSRPRCAAKRERQGQRLRGSRYHKSSKVLIRSHTRRLSPQRGTHRIRAPTWRIIPGPLRPDLCPRDIAALFVLRRRAVTIRAPRKSATEIWMLIPFGDHRGPARMRNKRRRSLRANGLSSSVVESIRPWKGDDETCRAISLSLSLSPSISQIAFPRTAVEQRRRHALCACSE